MRKRCNGQWTGSHGGIDQTGRSRKAGLCGGDPWARGIGGQSGITAGRIGRCRGSAPGHRKRVDGAGSRLWTSLPARVHGRLCDFGLLSNSCGLFAFAAAGMNLKNRLGPADHRRLSQPWLPRDPAQAWSSLEAVARASQPTDMVCRRQTASRDMVSSLAMGFSPRWFSALHLPAPPRSRQPCHSGSVHSGGRSGW